MIRFVGCRSQILAACAYVGTTTDKKRKIKELKHQKKHEVDGHYRVRSFEITASYEECELDSGWLVITGPYCGWERRQGVVPGILYSKKTHNMTWNDNQGRNCL